MGTAYLYIRISTDKQKRKKYALPKQVNREITFIDPESFGYSKNMACNFCMHLAWF